MHKQSPKLIAAFKKGFLLGAFASLGIYSSVRMLFTGFDFTLVEEIENIIKITVTGGLLLGAGLLGFILLELLIERSKSTKISFINFSEKKIGKVAA